MSPKIFDKLARGFPFIQVSSNIHASVFVDFFSLHTEKQKGIVFSSINSLWGLVV